MCIQHTISQAIINECNQALFVAQNNIAQCKKAAVNVLTTCSAIADSAGMLDLNASIQQSLAALKANKIVNVQAAYKKPKCTAHRPKQTDVYKGLFCPGCSVKLTSQNAGGYRTYCTGCVSAMPPLPNEPGNHGYQLQGEYPHFKWVAAKVAS